MLGTVTKDVIHAILSLVHMFQYYTQKSPFSVCNVEELGTRA